MKKKEDQLLLSATLLLSTIGSITGSIIYFSASIFFNKAKSIIVNFTEIRNTNIINPMFFNILGVLYTLSLLGVIIMSKRQKKGLYLYITSQIIILSVPVLWMGINAFSFLNLIFTFLFIGIYFSNIKYLN